MHRLHNLARIPSVIILLRTLHDFLARTLLAFALASLVPAGSVRPFPRFPHSNFSCSTSQGCGDDPVGASTCLETCSRDDACTETRQTSTQLRRRGMNTYPLTRGHLRRRRIGFRSPLVLVRRIELPVRRSPCCRGTRRSCNGIVQHRTVRGGEGRVRTTRRWGLVRESLYGLFRKTCET